MVSDVIKIDMCGLHLVKGGGLFGRDAHVAEHALQIVREVGPTLCSSNQIRLLFFLENLSCNTPKTTKNIK